MQIYTRSKAYCAGKRENNSERNSQNASNQRLREHLFQCDSEDLALFAIYQTINLKLFFFLCVRSKSIYLSIFKFSLAAKQHSHIKQDKLFATLE